MFKELIETLRKEDENQDRYFKYKHPWDVPLDDFYDFLIEYFELENIRKQDDDTKKPYHISSKEYFKQKSDELDYLEYILESIKAFIPLIFKISDDPFLVRKLREINLPDESIVKMISNFATLRRTGRPKKIYSSMQEKFAKLKTKYSNIWEYHDEIESYYEIEGKGSMRDYALAARKHGLTNELLREFLVKMDYFHDKAREWSRATIYRFDKDLIKLKKVYVSVEVTLNKLDFYYNSVLKGE